PLRLAGELLLLGQAAPLLLQALSQAIASAPECGKFIELRLLAIAKRRQLAFQLLDPLIAAGKLFTHPFQGFFAEAKFFNTRRECRLLLSEARFPRGQEFFQPLKRGARELDLLRLSLEFLGLLGD